jgi:predicted phage terminase large subunit-like protein
MPPTVLTASKTTPEAQTKAGLRLACQLDLFYLARAVLFRHLTPNLLTEALHGRLVDYMQTTPYDENLYLLSRGFFKSSIITTTAVIQRILADPANPLCQQRWRHRPCGPNTRILIASNKGENAEDFLTGIKGHLETNERLLWLFPDILVRDPQRNAREWTKSAITVTRSRRDLRESTIQAIGVTGELTSKHYDHGVFDDIVGKENSATKDEREKVWDFLMKARPLFDPGATKDYIGTCWHYADAWARLKAQRARGEIKLGLYEVPCWRKTHPRAPDDPQVRDGVAGAVPGHGWVAVTFPERFCLERTDDDDLRLALLPERRREPSNFNAQYLLDPSSADTAHFPRLDPQGQAYLQIETASPPLADLWVAMSVDPAQSLHKWADFSAIAVGGFDRRGDLWLLELWQGKRDDEGLIRRMYDLHARFTERGGQFKAIGIEAIGFAKSYRHVLTIEGDRRGYYLPAIAYERDTKITKQVRIGGIQGQWMGRQIHALESCEALADFVDQADKFRMEADNDHDDLLDAVADLYQLRGRPSEKADPFASDELAQRTRWEQAQQATRPELDRMSLRVMWDHHQRRVSREADEEARALSAVGGGMELWS